jgi:hypothetical protein
VDRTELEMCVGERRVELQRLSSAEQGGIELSTFPLMDARA